MTDAAAQVEAARKALAEAEAALAAEAAAAQVEPADVTPRAGEATASAPGPLAEADVLRIQAGYAFDGPALEMGALVNGDARPDVPIRIPLAMMNRHGLVAGATSDAVDVIAPWAKENPTVDLIWVLSRSLLRAIGLATKNMPSVARSIAASSWARCASPPA